MRKVERWLIRTAPATSFLHHELHKLIVCRQSALLSMATVTQEGEAFYVQSIRPSPS